MLEISQNNDAENMGIRAVAAIAADLERITVLTRDCVEQFKSLRGRHTLNLTDYTPLLAQVLKGISVVEDALLKNNTSLALKLGEAESKLNKSYRKLLEKYTRQLKERTCTEDVVVGLFVAHLLKQMGETLLHISGSIVSSNIGQAIDMQRFHALRETVNTFIDDDVASLDIKTVAETRSGSGISSVQYTDDNNDKQLAIFKEGEKKKVKEELNGAKLWHQMYPGIAPKILTYKKQGDTASLLIEHLQGTTFEQLAIHGSKKTLQKARNALSQTLRVVWQETRDTDVIPANFIVQTQQRLKDVCALHPHFEQADMQIGACFIPGIERCLKQARRLEKQFPPPFSVFIHGDFNIDNILYDSESQNIHFVDLHRSRYFDYVQDVSVFMVSNYRLQALDKATRERISLHVHAFYKQARQFAKSQKDKTFEVRLAFGLVRSFITSTRFILDASLAQRMFKRGMYILHQLCNMNPSDLHTYRLPIAELFID